MLKLFGSDGFFVQATHQSSLRKGSMIRSMPLNAVCSESIAPLNRTQLAVNPHRFVFVAPVASIAIRLISAVPVENAIYTTLSFGAIEK
ncbi:hypothetical protein EDM60_18845 [Brevibacillus parabrevis]|nr:hypothetical protein EDM60_18845 [Brevibacillus parabrevis]